MAKAKNLQFFVNTKKASITASPIIDPPFLTPNSPPPLPPPQIYLREPEREEGVGGGEREVNGGPSSQGDISKRERERDICRGRWREREGERESEICL